MKSPKSILFLIIIISLVCSKSYAQCPTVIDNVQTFCDIDSLLISDLQATDEGTGVAWFATPTSTTPLNGTDAIANGVTYYADNTAGNCGDRQEVLVNVLGPPIGLNFQGVCVENASDATLGDLEASGNDVQWYSSPTGGVSLNTNTVLADDTIYYADQASPLTGCRTSRLAIFVNVGIVDIPIGDSIQEFCISTENIPTVADLVASGTNNWYLSISSALVLDPSTPLIDGQNYYATSLDPPCESDNRLEVTVNLINQPNPGIDGVLDICSNDTSTYNLLNSLGGNPDTNGTWSPALSSGTGIFNPSIDPAGTYTYTVSSPNVVCSDASATVTVSFITPPMAGSNGTLDLCEGDTSTYNLFDSLGGNPDTNGIWSPTLVSGTGIFDPTQDPEGIYTYTVPSANPACTDATATVTVTFVPKPDAGTNGTLDLCEDDTSTYNLFDSLGGNPNTDGTWSPALTSGTGIFDPSTDPEGIYTYTVSSTNPACPNDATATVTITFIPAPNAGTNGTLDLCEGDTSTYNLFDSLGGNPDPNGTWSPSLTSGTGIFDPSTDLEGIYTYTVSSTNPVCPNDATTTVTVTFIPEPDAGTNGILDLCENDTSTYNLFDSLGGNPNTDGTWSPALTSDTGLFDPTIDPEGVYTYTVTSTNPACPDATATVTVTFIPTSNAGLDGVLDLCENDTSTYNLFDSLGGTPDANGTWSPTLTSGTGVFDPSIDPEGMYTYTVPSTNPACPDATATITVTFIPAPNAGTDGVLDLCEDDTSTYDLLDSLGGNPDANGTWSPALASGTGIFDPNIDPEGAYTYTVPSTNPECPNDAVAIVTVTFVPIPNAGTDGTLDLCEDDTSTYDLLDSLGGNPNANGTWSPALASGTGVFDPTIDSEGVYTYTVTSLNSVCSEATATVTVAFLPSPNAGTDGILELCQDDNSTYNLFDSLEGTPDNNGTWSPVLTSGTGIFDPTIDPFGAYTYTVPSANPECPDATAIVTVIQILLPSAGLDGTLDVCLDDTSTYDLFDSLGGTPDANGTWSPALASGTGIFDPSVDTAGTYTYTLDQPECNLFDSSEVIVTFVENPDISGLEINIPNICSGEDLEVSLSNMSMLVDGDYAITFQINGPNSFTDSLTVSIVNGESSFVIPSNSLTQQGMYEFVITDFINIVTNCNADLSNISAINFEVYETITPELITGGNSFCTEDEATIQDLSANIITPGVIEWYLDITGGSALSIDTVIEDGVTYYASVTTNNGCSSNIRLEVLVTIEPCEEDLIIPDGFSPNGDNINDTFLIRNLDELYPDFKLTIYNRNGNKLYEGDINTPKWNGTTTTNRVGGGIVPVGVYFYILEFNDGIRASQQGRVYLSR